ncbi:hypothetical protein GCM10027346_30310 [Hymenobacter seoulensis]
MEQKKRVQKSDKGKAPLKVRSRYRTQQLCGAFKREKRKNNGRLMGNFPGFQTLLTGTEFAE